MERGIQYLRELAVLEMVHNIGLNFWLFQNWDVLFHNPCGISLYGVHHLCMPTHCQKWPGKRERNKWWINSLMNSSKISLSFSLRACVSAVEKHSEVAQQLKGNKSSVLSAWTSISDTRSKHFLIQDRRYIGYTPRANRWSYLHGHGEDMRKWDGKLTWSLEVWICELRGKAITKESSSWKMTTSVSSGQFFKQSRWSDLISEFDNQPCGLHSWLMNRITRTRRALPPVRWRKGTIGFIGLCGFNGLAHQNHGSIRA